MTDKIFVEDMRHLQRLQQKITRDLRGELQITPHIELVEPNGLPRSEGKAMRLIDQRHL
jgi:phenylacetate-CoA ligase